MWSVDTSGVPAGDPARRDAATTPASLPASGLPVPRTSPTVRRILMTADAVGGVWQYALDLGRALAGRGVHITIAVMGPGPGAPQRRDAERAGLAVVDRPFRLEWMDEPWEDVARAGEWLLALERAVRPDIVHLNGYSHAALPWSAPVIVVAHSCVRTWWRAVKGENAPERFDHYRRAVARGLASARAVVAPTVAMLDALRVEYGVEIAGRVIPNGLRTAEAEAPADWAEKQRVVLAAGRLWDEGKNIGSLCAVAHRLPWPVCVAGDVREPGGRECQLTGVRWLGRLPADEMGRWYRRAAIYALPARYEPFGLSVLEAARARCALVLGDIASLRENWDGAAEFVPPDDREALASAIQGLVADPVRRRTLAECAWSRAAGFSIETTADQYVRLYEDFAA